MTRVVVIGAGLLGASVADELAARGATVSVLERDRPAAGTSGASFAWINAQDKVPEPYFALNADGVQAYPALAAELGGDWYHPGGDVAIAPGPAAARLAERVERHRALGYAVRELDRDAVATLEPDVHLPADGELAVAHFFEEAWVDAPALVERWLARATERGAEVRSGTGVTGFRVDGGRVTAVRTPDGEVPADEVVLAAGPASESVAELAGVRLPMAPNPGLLVTTRPVGARVSHIVHASGVALRPDGNGRLVLSSREVDASLDPDTRSLDADAPASREVLGRAAGVVPALRDASVADARIGVRSVSVDGLPVTGFGPSLENLYLVVSHSGATLAPVLGRLVASEVRGGHEARLDDYRPARFA